MFMFLSPFCVCWAFDRECVARVSRVYNTVSRLEEMSHARAFIAEAKAVGLTLARTDEDKAEAFANDTLSLQPGIVFDWRRPVKNPSLTGCRRLFINFNVKRESDGMLSWQRLRCGVCSRSPRIWCCEIICSRPSHTTRSSRALNREANSRNMSPANVCTTSLDQKIFLEPSMTCCGCCAGRYKQ